MFGKYKRGTGGLLWDPDDENNSDLHWKDKLFVVMRVGDVGTIVTTHMSVSLIPTAKLRQNTHALYKLLAQTFAFH